MIVLVNLDWNHQKGNISIKETIKLLAAVIQFNSVFFSIELPKLHFLLKKKSF